MKTKTTLLHLLACGFCGKHHRDKTAARWYIKGNDFACICSACVAICNEIIAENEAKALAGGNQPSGSEASGRHRGSAAL